MTKSRRAVKHSEPSFIVSFGRAVRARREKRRMTQALLAAATHVSVGTISRIENGYGHEKLAAALKTKPSAFFAAVKL